MQFREGSLSSSECDESSPQKSTVANKVVVRKSTRVRKQRDPGIGVITFFSRPSKPLKTVRRNVKDSKKKAEQTEKEKEENILEEDLRKFIGTSNTIFYIRVQCVYACVISQL